jgi:hypothetical protein
MQRAASLVLQADTCRRLADSATELWVAVSLRELAEEFLARADRASAVASESAVRATAPHAPLARRVQCAACKERVEIASGACYCRELDRRTAYDAERQRRGLIPLYRPPSMR